MEKIWERSNSSLPVNKRKVYGRGTRDWGHKPKQGREVSDWMQGKHVLL